MNPSPSPPPASTVNWQRTASMLFCAAVGLLALWLTFRFALGIIAPFLLAYLLSRAVRPLSERLTKRTRLPKSVAAAGLVILTVGLVSALTVGGVRRGIREVSRLAEGLTTDTEGLTAAVEAVLSRVQSLSAHIPFLRRFEDAPFYADLCASVDSLVESGVAKLTEAVTARLPGAAMTVAGLVPVSELKGLKFACGGSAGGCSSSRYAAGQCDLSFYCGISSGIYDLTSIDSCY